MYRAFIVILIVSGLFLGCATSNVSHSYVLSNETTNGLAVVSLTFEGLAAGESPAWHYHRLDVEGGGVLLTSTFHESLDWTTPRGRLAYLRLPSGSYEFYKVGFPRVRKHAGTYWTIGENGVPTNTNPYFAGFNGPTYDSFDADPVSIQFEVKPGKATYIGNLHFVWNESKRKGIVTLHDQSKRDLELLSKKLPSIPPERIIR